MDDERCGTDLAEYYGDLLAQQQESGLSVVEFASRSGVSSATLYSWRRRLGRVRRRPRALEVQVSDGHEVESARGALKLVISERFRIDLEPDFDAGSLERLLGVLARC